MKRAILWFSDHPLVAMALVLAITIGLGWQLPKLRLVSSTDDFTVRQDPARGYYDQFKQRFGNDTVTTIVVKADDVFGAGTLRAIQRISDSLDRSPEVSRVESLTTLRNLKGDGDVLTTDLLVGVPVPTAPEDLARIRADALGNRVFVGNIVSPNGRVAAIHVYTVERPGDDEFNARFTAQVEALIRAEAAPDLTIYQLGGPYTDATVSDFILKDLRRSTPVALVVIFILLFLAFRMLQGVVIPLVTGILSVIWALGLMALFGIPLSILTVVIPTLLLVIGATEDVHMLSEYHHLLEGGLDKLSAIRAMIRQTSFPIFVTTATTVFGFASLVTSDVTMLIQFGYASSMALAANFVVTVLTLPTLLRFWPVPRRLRLTAFEEERPHALLPRFMERLGEFNLRYRLQIAVVALLLLLASLVGWYNLRVDTDYIGFFPERSALRQRLKDFQASLGGVASFSVVVESGREGGLKDPAVLRMIMALQDFLNGAGGVDKTVSVADYVRKMHREMNGGDPAFEVIPDSPDQIAQYLLTLESKELAKYVDFKASSANILVRHKFTGTWELSALLTKLDAYLARSVPANVKVRYTGDAILVRDAADYMAINEITSFGSTFLLIALVHAWLFRSLRAGFLSLIPDVIPVIYSFGLMGLLGIPLNPGTAMIASIALGIAVDDTVHHMITFSRQVQEHGDRRIAMFNTMKTQGRPVIYVSLALAGGFFSLALSNFLPIVYFGLLSGVVMLIAMLAELILTPLVVHAMPFGRRFRFEQSPVPTPAVETGPGPGAE